MATSIVLFIAQMWITKMRSSKLIFKSNPRKQMARSSFDCNFHDLNYFELDFLFIFLEFIIDVRSSSYMFLSNIINSL